MKSIQVRIHKGLSAQLDAEARKDGRSAVLRPAIRAYLEQRRAAEIRAQYQRAYGAESGLGDEFSGWEDQGSWP
jgi:metal-responsive CopG/Arc/MetJ family transcriptional regulator